jgi:hypothetical protein
MKTTLGRTAANEGWVAARGQQPIEDDEYSLKNVNFWRPGVLLFLVGRVY